MEKLFRAMSISSDPKESLKNRGTRAGQANGVPGGNGTGEERRLRSDSLQRRRCFPRSCQGGRRHPSSEAPCFAYCGSELRKLFLVSGILRCVLQDVARTDKLFSCPYKRARKQLKTSSRYALSLSSRGLCLYSLLRVRVSSRSSYPFHVIFSGSNDGSLPTPPLGSSNGRSRSETRWSSREAS